MLLFLFIEKKSWIIVESPLWDPAFLSMEWDDTRPIYLTEMV